MVKVFVFPSCFVVKSRSGIPFLNQDIDGCGFPTICVERTTVSPSLTAKGFNGSKISGGSLLPVCTYGRKLIS